MDAEASISRQSRLNVYQRMREVISDGAIAAGGLLMVIGCLIAVFWEPGLGNSLAVLWPSYLGGVVAVLLGWLRGLRV